MTGPGFRAIALAAWLCAAVPAVFVHGTGEVLPDDDAFIVYRYVDHWRAGRGLVYNEGERVFGATTPLYVAWLAALKALLPAVPTPELAVRANLALFLAASLALSRLLWRLTGSAPWALAGGVAFLVQPDLLRVSIGGMESYLFLTLALAALSTGLGAHPERAFSLAGLATLARPEGALCAALLVLTLPRGDRRLAIRCALAYAAPVLCWAVPATAYFGTPVPHSLLAKSAPLYPLAPGTAALSLLDRLVHWTTRGRPRAVPADAAVAWVRLVLALAVLAAGALGLMRARERRARCRAVLLAFAMLWGFYALANPLLFDWYWPALWTALLVCLVAGALAWVPSRHSGEPVRRGAAAVPPLLLAAWLLAGTGLAWLDFARAARGGWGELASLARVGDPVVRRIDAYRRAAEWIDAAGGGDAVVLSAEIGALGYHHGGPILDAGGLVSPAALPFLPVPAGERASAAVSAIPRGLVRAEAPEFIVTHPVFAARSLLGWADFERRYALVHRVPLARPLWGRRQLLVYRRRGGA